MKQFILTFIIIALLGCNRNPTVQFKYPEPIKISLQEETVKIRLLVLKHSIESMADGDADLAINAAKKAAAKGLNIKDIGNHYIDENGEVKYYIWNDLPKLREFVSQQMKVGAEIGDTVIIFTIGHGMASGDLHNLGQRALVMQALAAAAEENQQKTLWWQLSCHACAKLPDINTLPLEQQKLFSMYASSTASEVSAAGVQGKIMEQVFLAMAEKNSTIDPDHNNIITGNELKSFLNNSSNRGSLLFMHDLSEPIFGIGSNLANQIPIIDRNSPQRDYPKDYIPFPK